MDIDQFFDSYVSFDLSFNSIVSYNPKVATLAEAPDSKAKSAAIERARLFQASLPFELPSCVIPMLPSHVTGFLLGLPKKFCDTHMPKHDETVVLLDKNSKEFSTKFLVDKTGLSGGWRGFSIAHELLEGDALVFQLIDQWKFKVYIIRVNGANEIDGALALPNLVPCEMNKSIISLNEIRSDGNLHFVEEPIEITDRDLKTLKQSRIPIVKVRWNSKRGHKLTWEGESQMKLKYPHLFQNNIDPTS